MITARLTKNKYDIEVMCNGKKIEVVDVELCYEGKRQILVLKVGEFKILPESTCPERHRFERVMAAFGDRAAIDALQPACSMIQLNAKACEGCSQRPL